MSFYLVEQPGLPSVAPWYSFDMALVDATGGLRYGERYYSGQPNPGSNTFMLWEAGCRTGDSWNCTAACLDTELGPKLIWNTTNSMYTLQNCIVYPFIALALAAGVLGQGSGTADLTEKYHIRANGDAAFWNTTDGWPVINQCFNAYCNASSS